VISHPPHRLFVLRLCRGYRDFHGQSIPRTMRFVGSADSDRVDNFAYYPLQTAYGFGGRAKRAYASH
jgi:hypothetical protein